MEIRFPLGPPFEETLILVHCLLGSLGPPRYHALLPPYPYPSPLLSSQTMGPYDKQLLSVYSFYDGDDYLPNILLLVLLLPLLLLGFHRCCWRIRGRAPGEKNDGQSIPRTTTNDYDGFNDSNHDYDGVEQLHWLTRSPHALLLGFTEKCNRRRGGPWVVGTTGGKRKETLLERKNCWFVLWGRKQGNIIRKNQSKRWRRQPVCNENK